MNSKIIANGILRAIAILLGISLLLWFIFKIQSVIVYLVIAAVVSLIGRPVVIFLTRKLKLNQTLSIIITMILFVGFIVGLIGLFIPLVVQQGQNLALLDIDKLQYNMQDLYGQFVEYFGLKRFEIKDSLKEYHLLSKLDYSVIPEFLNSFISGFGTFSIGLFSVIFISFFFFKDNKMFEEGLLTLVPDDKEKRFIKSFATIKDLLSRYFLGLLFQILILFILYTATLLIVGVDNAIVIAFLCALLNLIPYIGPLISAVLIITLTMTSHLGESFSGVILPKTIGVIIGFLIAQLIDNFFSQPIIFSKSVKSHPLEIFLVIIIAGILFGIIGMVVAIPTYTALKVILKEFFTENKIVKKLTKNI
ncbi:AI-2E family transporter [Mangrovimonas aestuarii]|uniref:AI-2E family transporter n=1 Tax=Mangrovimonas aestuarii TaxID=3018443 RepID=UPI0023791D2B|nr:AI-2E family transporter [Mangrovimonas aestuarii]